MAERSIFISVDMEGIAGVFTDAQVSRGHPEFTDACRLMTLETNAAVEGAFEGGATSVVVSDSHGDMHNLVTELLDPRSDLVQGTPKWPWGMMTGFDETFHGTVFVGYHARAGTASALMDHTFTTEIMDVRLNGTAYGEIGVNAFLAAAHGVPTLVVSGDDAACAEATDVLPEVRTVAVKHGIGRFVARSLSPSRARVAVRDTVRTAVSSQSLPAPRPMAGPVTVEVDVARSVLAEQFMLVPGTERSHARGVLHAAADYSAAYQCLMAWCQLVRSV